MDILGRYEDIFCNAAIAKGEGLKPNDGELFETMKDSYRRLYNHPSGKKRIESLLAHESGWVKSWIATQVLSESGCQQAEGVLIDLCSDGGALGFGAEMVLTEYQKGSLKPPFGIRP